MTIVQALKGSVRTKEETEQAKQAWITARHFYLLSGYIIAAAKNQGHQDPEGRDLALKIAVHGVKYFSRDLDGQDFTGTTSRGGYNTKKTIRARWHMLQNVLAALMELSPDRIAQTFPAMKHYKGARYEMKDYFYSMQVLEKAREQHPAAPYWKDDSEVLGFLMEWDNPDISFFLLAALHIMDDYRALQGERPLIESFILETTGADVHIPKYFTKGKDKKGRTWVYDDEGNCLGREYRRRPRWIRPAGKSARERK